ncbi:contactin-associated protein-like 2 [Oculina patagonica]
MNRNTAVFRVKLTLLFVLSRTQSFEAADTCSGYPPLIRFSKLVPDHVLKGRVISSVHVASDQECQMKCILSRLCDSFNLGPQTYSKHYPCEVLDGRIMRKKTKRKGWKFRAGKCQTSNCQNGGICYTLNSDEPLCACVGYWKGATCNQLFRTTCSDWKALNSSAPSGFYVISPVYQTGVTPFTVYCNMTAKNGVGVTVISHDSEDRTYVSGCDPPGCYSRDISYQGASLLQLGNLAAVSGQCEQFIKYECFRSLLKSGWWVSRNGTRMNYWGGATPGSGKCACGMTNSCASSLLKCNCDKNDYVIREDSGYLTDKSSLPVSQLKFGDTVGIYEHGWHTLGKLYCYGFPV